MYIGFFKERVMVMIMKYAIDCARKTMLQGYGGPFGAVIMKNGEVIAISSNTVLKDNDPTAHAEVNAIREASQKLGTYDLSGCVLYATGYPCPMCLSAIMWANIHEVYYGTDLDAAKKIGFRDDFIYHFIKNGNQGENLVIKQIDEKECLKLIDEYQSLGKTIY